SLLKLLSYEAAGRKAMLWTPKLTYVGCVQMMSPRLFLSAAAARPAPMNRRLSREREARRIEVSFRGIILIGAGPDARRLEVEHRREPECQSDGGAGLKAGQSSRRSPPRPWRRPRCR